MKLRNKKTGEIVEGYHDEPIELFIYLGTDEEGDKLNHKTYHSITELNEDWEDYQPKEPLIKDEKIRKAVRAWAEANGVHKVDFEYITGDGSVLKDFCGARMWFYVDLGLVQRRNYTIAELCGEEEND